MAVDRYNLLTQVKTALRTSLASDIFDEYELEPMIDACLCDMQGAGVDTERNEYLVRQAIVFYCKAHFGLQIDEKWLKAYESTRDALAARTAEVSA